MALQAPVVLALPRGGVPVGAEIARALGAPLDVAFVRKIGAPDQPELAVGAIADGDGDPEIVLNHKLVRALDLSEAYIARRPRASSAPSSGAGASTPTCGRRSRGRPGSDHRRRRRGDRHDHAGGVAPCAAAHTHA